MNLKLELEQVIFVLEVGVGVGAGAGAEAGAGVGVGVRVGIRDRVACVLHQRVIPIREIPPPHSAHLLAVMDLDADIGATPHHSSLG